MENNELTHHGIKGQRWGVRRTPAQLGHKTPNKRKTSAVGLSFFKKKKSSATSKSSKLKGKTPEEISAAKKAKIEEKKKKILASRSVKDLYDNAHLFTTEELRTAHARLQLEKNIKDLDPKAFEKGDGFLKKTADTTNKFSDAVTGTSKAYNSVARVWNAFSGKDGSKLPVIDMGGGSKKKGGDDDGDGGSSKPKSETKPKSEPKPTETAKPKKEPKPKDDIPTVEADNIYKPKNKFGMFDGVRMKKASNTRVDDIADKVAKEGYDYMEKFMDTSVKRIADSGTIFM